MDRPDPPLVKLGIRQAQAEEQGKEFDEVRERKVLGLPPVQGRPPVFIAASKARATMIAREESQPDPIAEEAAGVSSDEKDAIIAEQRAQIAEMQRQLAEVLGKPLPEQKVEKPKPGPGKFGEVPDGEPSMDWTLNQLKEFVKREAMPPLPKNGFGASKAMVLEHIAENTPKATEEGDE